MCSDRHRALELQQVLGPERPSARPPRLDLEVTGDLGEGRILAAIQLRRRVALPLDELGRRPQKRGLAAGGRKFFSSKGAR